MAIKIAIVLAFGIPAVAVLIFEVVLNATSMFNHANVTMPGWLDRVAALFVVTPDMHRVHHSIMRAETDSNFGFNLPWWDRLFGTYRAQPEAGHTGMTIGIPMFRDPARVAHRPLADAAVPRMTTPIRSPVSRIDSGRLVWRFRRKHHFRAAAPRRGARKPDEIRVSSVFPSL